MLPKIGPRDEPIVTPLVCLYKILLNLNSTSDVTLFISSMKTAI